MPPELLQPGQKILVSGPNTEVKFISYIRDTGSGEIRIDIPACRHSVVNQDPFVLNAGDMVRVQMSVEDHLYEFISRVLAPGSGGSRHIVLAFPGHIKKIDKRRYIRTDKLLMVQYALLPNPGEEPALKKAEALNISAGGMKLAVPEFIEKGTEIILQFILPAGNNYRKMKAVSIITRTESVSSSALPHIYHVGVKFANIRKSDLDTIQKYVMRLFWTRPVKF